MTFFLFFLTLMIDALHFVNSVSTFINTFINTWQFYWHISASPLFEQIVIYFTDAYKHYHYTTGLNKLKTMYCMVRQWLTNNSSIIIRRATKNMMAVSVPRTHYTKYLYAYNPYLAKTPSTLTLITMIWSGQNFTHATTAELSWHVQNSDLILSLKINIEHVGFSRYLNNELM